ncbi:M15 family metallopeptidase [Myxococcota bacterium]|nr:M15 family metallopeptidase [Myxococcota bacterium]
MTIRLRARSVGPLVLSFVVGACAVDPGSEAHDHEDEPTAEDVDYALAGTIDCTPRDDTGYSSGAARSITVVTVDGKPVERETADAYWLMRQAAARDGVTIVVVSGFRTMAEQRYLYSCYVNCSCNDCNLAARPGYSNHQSGLALDLNTASPGVLSWMNRNAARFGFARTVPSEPWHWELVGRAAGTGPCAAGTSTPPDSSSDVEWVTPRDGGVYTNGVWMKVRAPGAHHVRYSASGFLVGASEDADDDFSARYVFSQLGRRTIEAVAYDADDRELARATITIDVAPSTAPTTTLALTSPTDLGWFRNGVDLKADAGPEAARVEYYAGTHLLASSSDRASNFRGRYVFGTLGFRVITAIAKDTAGRELARRSAVVRVLPGDETGTTPSVRFLARDGDTLDNGAPITVLGSDGIRRVTLTADGFDLGDATATASGFTLERTFTRTGARRLVATGYDAAGRTVADHTVMIVVR